MKDKYKTDYYGWVREQAELLASRRFSELDLPGLEEEILSLAWNQKQYIEYHLESLIFYLLLWQYQPYWRGHEWKGAIKILRTKLERELRDNKSLKRELDNMIEECCYHTSLYRAQRAVGHEDLPEECPYTAKEILDKDFFPE